MQATAARYGRDFFLFVGVLRYYKGLHLLLEAARNATFRVVIVGTGPEEKRLHEMAKSMRLDNVVFTGYIDDKDKIALLRLCRAFVLPSHLRSEAFGVCLLEAAMSGKPMVTTNAGTGTSYVNINEETGLVVDPDCPEALRQAMERLDCNQDEAIRMGQIARSRFESIFTSDSMGQQYAELYEQLVNANMAGR